MPFVGYFSAIATYSSYFVITEDQDKWTGFEFFKTINWLFALGFTAYFGSIEVKQMINKRKMAAEQAQLQIEQDQILIENDDMSARSPLV